MSDSYKIYASKDYVNEKVNELLSEENKKSGIRESITIKHNFDLWTNQDTPGTTGNKVMNGVQRLTKVSDYVPTMEELFSDNVRFVNTKYNDPTEHVNPKDQKYVFNGAYGRWAMTISAAGGHEDYPDGSLPLVLVVPEAFVLEVGSGKKATFNCFEPGTYMWDAGIGKKCGYIEFTYTHINSIIPAPATATIGQTIVVKTIDENGKPTEWKAVTSMTEDMVNELIDAKIATIPNAEEASF